MKLDVLLLDNHCLAVDKPAGVLVQSDRTGDATLAEAAQDFLRARFEKPGRVYLGVVHRIDRPVSGVVLFARTSKAASRLSEAFRRSEVTKTYLAVVEGVPAQATGTLENHLLKDTRSNRSRVVTSATSGARLARLQYRVVDSVPGGTLLEVQPETGRSHQIRVQLSANGTCIVGDLRYGSQRQLGGMIALHARALDFPHPTRAERVTVECAPPSSWDALLRA